MAHVRGGKAHALAALVHRYADKLLTFIERMIGDHQRSEDLFQEVWLNVWRHRRKYDHQRLFQAWLFAIARNTCRTEFRRASLPIVGGDTVMNQTPTEEESGPLNVAVASETSTKIAEAIRLLPVRQREVLVLRIWSGLSYAEISSAMDCSPATARVQMHNALANLRGILDRPIET